MSFEHCHSCLPPVRYPGCQDNCPYYAEDIAKVRAAKAEEKRQAQAEEKRQTQAEEKRQTQAEEKRQTQAKDDYLGARQFKTRRGQKLRK